MFQPSFDMIERERKRNYEEDSIFAGETVQRSNILINEALQSQLTDLASKKIFEDIEDEAKLLKQTSFYQFFKK